MEFIYRATFLFRFKFLFHVAYLLNLCNLCTISLSNVESISLKALYGSFSFFGQGKLTSFCSCDSPAFFKLESVFFSQRMSYKTDILY